MGHGYLSLLNSLVEVTDVSAKRIKGRMGCDGFLNNYEHVPYQKEAMGGHRKNGNYLAVPPAAKG